MKRLTFCVAVIGSAVLSGCGLPAKINAAPDCTSENWGGLVLAAQSVPSATQVPCVDDLPPGWQVSSADVRNGRTSFTLDSDRAGLRALKVTLTRSCDVRGATQVPTDEPGTQRFERIVSVDHGFRASRMYRFTGGCVTYQLRFSERGQALVNETSVAIGFRTRAAIDQRIRSETNGDQGL